jgi:hypothetical protein
MPRRLPPSADGCSCERQARDLTTNFWSPQRQHRKLRANHRAQDLYVLEMV